MKIALVDDEVTQLEKLVTLIASELNTLVKNMTHQIDAYRNGKTFLDRWQPGLYDVVILDIFMGGLTGVDVAKQIRRSDPNVKLVFCSRSNEFAAESYQVNAQYYLVKPATPGSIANMLRRLNLELIQQDQTVTLPDGHTVKMRRILYTDYYNHVVSVHMKGGEVYRLRTNHAQMEELLCAEGFIISPSKGILVNFYEVTASTDDSFTMSDGTVLPISRRKSKDVLAAYNRFRFQIMRSEVSAQ